ncbi:MAG: MerR family transcriptional regulator [Synechococcaceae cyanobacterium ELA739]
MADPSPSSLASADGSGALYGLDELLAVAGGRLDEEISSRTVRLYATQGLIDRPGREGRSAVYGHRHLLQLLLIRSLARRGLSLAAIAPLCGLPDPELEQQLAQLESQGEAPPQETNPALNYLRDLKSSLSSSPPPSSSPALFSSSDDPAERSSSLLPLLGSPLLSNRSASPSRSPSRSSGSRDAASRWHRFSLAPGVELHISDAVSIPPAGTRRLAWLQRLIDRLIEQLDERQG